jgi:hypothetical protein
MITAKRKFLWNGPDKEKRSLMHKRLEEGGLNILHWKSRIAGVHSKWISRLQTCGETLQVFHFNNIEWGDPRSFITPFSKSDLAQLLRTPD